MYRHIVLFWLKDPTEENLLLARDMLRSLHGKIEGLLSCEVEADALRSDRSCHLCLNMLFRSKAALDAYCVHPAHLPVQAHMHAVRSASSAADYPITQPPRRMPDLYATLSSACAGQETLRRMLEKGVSGFRLRLQGRLPEASKAWLSTLRDAAAHAGIASRLLVDPTPADIRLESVRSLKPYALLLPFPHSEAACQALRNAIPADIHLFAKVSAEADLNALPLLLRHADTLVIDRAAMNCALPFHLIPSAQKEVASAANSQGIPFAVMGELLGSMVERPVPAGAEALDIHNAVLDGASALLLTDETAVGQHPVEAVEVLRKAAHSACMA